MKFSKKLLSLFVVGAMSAGVSHAAGSTRDFGQIYTECGLGALIFPTNEILAVVTNVTWDLGTTAVTSNLSSPDTCKGGKKKTAAFIYQSYAQLEQDLARGEGQHLNNLLTLASCPAEAQATVAAGLRDDLAADVARPAYGTATRYDQAKAMYEHLTQRAEAAACSL
ncbi:MAG: hypothetical protein RI907_2891 [Pseudomonadota bacterium]|jgi:hypothetical protein